jgi:hypothetical protein
LEYIGEMIFQYVLMYFLAWAFVGISGAQAIYCMWFSGKLRHLRRSPIPIDYYVLGVLFGPLNIIIAAMFWLIGIGRESK